MTDLFNFPNQPAHEFTITISEGYKFDQCVRGMKAIEGLMEDQRLIPAEAHSEDHDYVVLDETLAGYCRGFILNHEAIDWLAYQYNAMGGQFNLDNVQLESWSRRGPIVGRVTIENDDIATMFKLTFGGIQ